MKKRILNLYSDRKSIIFTIVLLGLCHWLDSLLPEGNDHAKHGSAIAAAVVAGVGALVSLFGGMAAKGKANKQALKQEALARKEEKRLKALENSRQKVLNQGAQIRGMKSQVFNPYANIAVATKGSELKMEQTDEALANTLDSINKSGTGAGGATALARMAAKSKAQIGASIEKQEGANQQLRMQGEAKMIDQKMALEQAALGAEADAWGRQETRDVSQLNRMSNLQANAQQQAMAFQMAGDQAMMQGMAGFVEGATTAGTAVATGKK